MKPNTTDALLAVLQARFAQHPQRHAGLAWRDVAARLKAAPAAVLASLAAMEDTGGEPDVTAQDRALQQLGEFDLKTSSWIATPPAVRALGGALFCDRRHGRSARRRRSASRRWRRSAR